jgi:hypothetical protein
LSLLGRLRGWLVGRDQGLSLLRLGAGHGIRVSRTGVQVAGAGPVRILVGPESTLDRVVSRLLESGRTVSGKWPIREAQTGQKGRRIGLLLMLLLFDVLGEMPLMGVLVSPSLGDPRMGCPLDRGDQFSCCLITS